MKETTENIAANRLSDAERAMRAASEALCDIGSNEAKQHASELLGAVKMVRQWELHLRRMRT